MKKVNLLILLFLLLLIVACNSNEPTEAEMENNDNNGETLENLDEETDDQQEKTKSFLPKDGVYVHRGDEIDDMVAQYETVEEGLVRMITYYQGEEVNTYYFENEDGIYSVGLSLEEAMDSIDNLDPDRLQLKYPLEIGQLWETPSGASIVKHEVVDIIPSYSTPYKTFDEVVKINMIVLENGEELFNQYLYFAEDYHRVGLDGRIHYQLAEVTDTMSAPVNYLLEPMDFIKIDEVLHENENGKVTLLGHNYNEALGNNAIAILFEGPFSTEWERTFDDYFNFRGISVNANDSLFRIVNGNTDYNRYISDQGKIVVLFDENDGPLARLDYRIDRDGDFTNIIDLSEFNETITIPGVEVLPNNDFLAFDPLLIETDDRIVSISRVFIEDSIAISGTIEFKQDEQDYRLEANVYIPQLDKYSQVRAQDTRDYFSNMVVPFDFSINLDTPISKEIKMMNFFVAGVAFKLDLTEGNLDEEFIDEYNSLYHTISETSIYRADGFLPSTIFKTDIFGIEDNVGNTHNNTIILPAMRGTGSRGEEVRNRSDGFYLYGQYTDLEVSIGTAESQDFSNDVRVVFYGDDYDHNAILGNRQSGANASEFGTPLAEVTLSPNSPIETVEMNVEGVNRLRAIYFTNTYERSEYIPSIIITDSTLTRAD
ncbi:hypothetical protein QA612_04715 [Evansella sp. AB-P1]|uniref:hypothetical protein n=1 Tax=Evansella sp. AB-P1 TaxID=3037653 RepID=UPI00241D4098|nr:hypothetical protein [Evansella sp. AB-P1]MDG5786784.1 hypothetical protein [Evansella sp. AB-P1]